MARGKKKESPTPEERLQAALVPESEQPYKVPGNWCWLTQNSIATFLNGRAYKQDELLEDSTNTPVLRVGNLFTNSSWYYSNLELDSDKYIDNGDLIYAWSASFGPFIWDGNRVIYHYHIWKVLLLSAIHKKYMYFWLLYDTERLKQGGHGTGMIHVTKAMMEAAPIPLPSIYEQQRIVDRIESLFAKLDEAKQKAQDALDSFETRKAAILHKAFTGELTAQWRKEHGVGMETWSSCKLIDILVEKPRNGYSPQPVDYVTACKSMTLSATTTGVFKPEFFKYIDEEIPEDSHLWLTPGDILIQRANSLEKVGMSAIYTGAEHEFIYPDLMMKLTVKEPNNKHYIDYYLKTDEILNYFRSNATGTAGNMPKINQKVVSETPLILPETQEQAEIVRLLDDLLAKEQQAKEAAEGVLEQIDLIKKAILARAFRGELGTNDPNEESAVELIKAVV